MEREGGGPPYRTMPTETTQFLDKTSCKGVIYPQIMAKYRFLDNKPFKASALCTETVATPTNHAHVGTMWTPYLNFWIRP